MNLGIPLKRKPYNICFLRGHSVSCSLVEPVEGPQLDTPKGDGLLLFGVIPFLIPFSNPNTTSPCRSLEPVEGPNNSPPPSCP